jgi:amino acid permease
MEKAQHEVYEYARRRIKQKKGLYFHFVFLLIMCLFMFIANHCMKIGYPNEWALWISTFWIFILILHFIKVYITDRFMNKNWEREQIDKLMVKQQIKIAELEKLLPQKE